MELLNANGRPKELDMDLFAKRQNHPNIFQVLTVLGLSPLPRWEETGIIAVNISEIWMILPISKKIHI